MGRFSQEYIKRGFDQTGANWWIGLSGGEPFLYSGLTELVANLTENHFVHLDTNLSCSIQEFVERIDPDRIVFLNCAFHPEELERRKEINRFIDKVLLLRSKGFSVILSYVTYPAILNRLEEYIALFKSYDLILSPKIFRGHFRKGLLKRRYPEGYTESERQLINGYLYDSIGKRLLNGRLCYRGRFCLAGHTFIRIHVDGKVTRCTSDRTYLGNLFKGDLKLWNDGKICKAKFCGCPFVARLNLIREEEDYREEFERLIHLNDVKNR